MDLEQDSPREKGWEATDPLWKEFGVLKSEPSSKPEKWAKNQGYLLGSVAWKGQTFWAVFSHSYKPNLCKQGVKEKRLHSSCTRDCDKKIFKRATALLIFSSQRHSEIGSFQYKPVQGCFPQGRFCYPMGISAQIFALRVSNLSFS